MMTQPSPPQGWVWSPKQTWLHSMLGDSPWSRGSTSLPQKQAYPDSIPASCKTQKELCKWLLQQFKTNLSHNAAHYKSIWHGCQRGKHWGSHSNKRCGRNKKILTILSTTFKMATFSITLYMITSQLCIKNNFANSQHIQIKIVLYVVFLKSALCEIGLTVNSSLHGTLWN